MEDCDLDNHSILICIEEAEQLAKLLASRIQDFPLLAFPFDLVPRRVDELIRE